MQGLLTGIRIVDLTRMLAGPYGTMLLADLGAELIKIEDHMGDHTRAGRKIASKGGMGAYFLSVNRNKKSVIIDLKTKDGLETFYDLVRTADVVVDNMRPKALKNLKCDYDDLKKINPKIISASLSGYGHTGPYTDRTAFDLTIQALSGGMGVTGEPGRPPVRMGFPIGDVGGGLMVALAIVSAINYRHTTGKGQKIDVSLLDTQISLASYMTAYWLVNKIESGPQGSRHGTIVPYEAFNTKDKWLVVACPHEKFWEGLCIGLDLHELIADERFNDALKRLKNREIIIPILQERFMTKTRAEWLPILKEVDIPYAPVNSLEEALADPQVLERKMVVDIHHPVAGDFQLAGNPIKASEADEIYEAPPLLGANTEEVLKSVLNYSDDKINELLENKAIGKLEEEVNV